MWFQYELRYRPKVSSNLGFGILPKNQNCEFGRTLLSGDNDMSRHYPAASTTGKSYSSIERVLCTFLCRVVKSPTWFLIFGFMFLSLFIRLSSKYLVW